MYKDKILSVENVESFDYEATKKNVIRYFMLLEKLEWELAKINARNGIVNYDFNFEYQRQPFSPINKDDFALSAKEYKEEELKKIISSYYWAVSILSDLEKKYIQESFINHIYQDELVDLLGFSSRDCDAFRKLRKSAIYKFADFLNLIVKK